MTHDLEQTHSKGAQEPMASSLRDLTASPAFSDDQARFFAFIDRHPECLEGASFKALERPETKSPARFFLHHYVPMQPWPTFLDSARLASLSELGIRMSELVQSVPERLFANDPQRLCQFYGLDPDVADTLQRILDLPWRAGGESMRGDFVLSDQRLQCIEMADTPNAGGIYNYQVAEACMGVPQWQRFLQEQGVQARFRDPWRTLLVTMIERAMARELHAGGSLNLAILISEPDDYEVALPYIAPQYPQILAALAPGVEGKIVFCDYHQLVREDDRLIADGAPVHILMQDYGDVLTLPIGLELEAWLEGIVDLYPGPMNWIYSDKRNLALISEHADSDAFSRAERQLIAEHVPWSRLVAPGPTTFRGKHGELGEILLTARQDLVLKPAQSYGGIGVQIGRSTSPDVWQELVRQALENSGTYIAQQHLPSDLLPYQWGEQGCELCEVNWGLFVAGKRFGGAYLRLCPPPDDGIINVTNGARDGCVLELIPTEEAGECSPTDLCWTFDGED